MGEDLNTAAASSALADDSTITVCVLPGGTSWRQQAASPTTALNSEDLNRGFESGISIFRPNKHEVESVDMAELLNKKKFMCDPFSSQYKTAKGQSVVTPQ